MTLEVGKVTLALGSQQAVTVTLWHEDTDKLPEEFKNYLSAPLNVNPGLTFFIGEGPDKEPYAYHRLSAPGDVIIKMGEDHFIVVSPQHFNDFYKEVTMPSDMLHTEYRYVVEDKPFLFDFGVALTHLKQGSRIVRKGWNGKGMFVYLVPAASYPVQTGAAKAYFGEGSMVPYNAYMAIKNVDGTVSTWVPSVNDCLAEDWYALPTV